MKRNPDQASSATVPGYRIPIRQFITRHRRYIGDLLQHLPVAIQIRFIRFVGLYTGRHGDASFSAISGMNISIAQYGPDW
jgi:hypothetical protein